MSKRRKRKKLELKKKDVERIELIVDFLIKFNLLAVPMYIVMFSGIEFYPLQLFLTDVMHGIITTLGYEATKSGITLTLVSMPAVANVIIGMDCTAWKSMYALAALMIASPVKNDRKKLKHILLGVSAVFVINIVRLVTTVLAGYWFGMRYLDIVHTLLWREGMIFAVVLIWLLWLKRKKEKQKVLFQKEQTILRRLFV